MRRFVEVIVVVLNFYGFCSSVIARNPHSASLPEEKSDFEKDFQRAKNFKERWVDLISEISDFEKKGCKKDDLSKCPKLKKFVLDNPGVRLQISSVSNDGDQIGAPVAINLNSRSQVPQWVTTTNDALLILEEMSSSRRGNSGNGHDILTNKKELIRMSTLLYQVSYYLNVLRCIEKVKEASNDGTENGQINLENTQVNVLTVNNITDPELEHSLEKEGSYFVIKENGVKTYYIRGSGDSRDLIFKYVVNKHKVIASSYNVPRPYNENKSLDELRIRNKICSDGNEIGEDQSCIELFVNLPASKLQLIFSQDDVKARAQLGPSGVSLGSGFRVSDSFALVTSGKLNFKGRLEGEGKLIYSPSFLENSSFSIGVSAFQELACPEGTSGEDCTGGDINIGQVNKMGPEPRNGFNAMISFGLFL